MELGGSGPRVTTEQGRGPRVETEQPEEDANRRGLACPVGTEEPVHLTGGHLQVQTVQSPDMTEVLDQTGNRYRGTHDSTIVPQTTERTFKILIMRSTPDLDLTTKARIRDAALARFPREGFGATTLRAVAADAAVSPALVVHHFGSKDGLRQACDEYVVRMYREAKERAMDDENLYNRSFAATAYEIAEPVLRYLGWALSRNHQAAGDLFDEMVREAVALSRLAIAKGLVRDSTDLENRAAVQMAMTLGAVVMHSHLQRNLGVDLLTAEGMAQLTPVLFEIFGGLFEPDALDRLRDTYQQGSAEVSLSI